MSASGIEAADISPLLLRRSENTVALLTAAYPPEPTFAEAGRGPAGAEFARATALDRLPVAPKSRGNIHNIRPDLPKPKNERLSPPAVRQVASISRRPRRGAEPRLSQNKNRTRANSPSAPRRFSPAPLDRSEHLRKVWQAPASGPKLAYASADAGVQSDGTDIADNPSPPYDRMTAVYDISAHMVYMPDGTKLEAHSGLGSMLDDPRHVRERMRGATPPHIYDLAMRESLFHGVPALRLKPVGGESAIYGRSGLLAHTYMLGPNGDSNGCVSFKRLQRSSCRPTEQETCGGWWWSRSWTERREVARGAQ